jgi:putative flippase GtrA
MQKSDFSKVTIIGALVGLLTQPILSNVLAGGVGVPKRVGIFLGFTVIAPVALYIAQLIDRGGRGLYQFAKFAAVGTLNSFIDIGIFNLETFLYGTSLISNELFAVFKAISFLCATTNSFFWNKNWTFADNESANPGQVGSFYGIALVGWGLNVGAATFVKAFASGSTESSAKLVVNILAPLVGIAVSFLWNFVGYKYFVFRKKE